MIDCTHAKYNLYSILYFLTIIVFCLVNNDIFKDILDDVLEDMFENVFEDLLKIYWKI